MLQKIDDVDRLFKLEIRNLKRHKYKTVIYHIRSKLDVVYRDTPKHS